MSVVEFQPLYTVKEVAQILKSNPTAVYELMNQGKLKYLILGSRKVRGADLEQFISTYPTEN